MTTHLALVGEQPMPVLLIDRHLRPARTLLVCTKRTQQVAERLQRLITNCEVLPQVEPYELNQVVRLLDERPSDEQNAVINLTGGTKIMMLAAFAHAMRRKVRFVYLESEQPPQHLHSFTFGNTGIAQTVENLPTLITTDDYLRAHLIGYHCEGYSREADGALTNGGRFEQAVHQALEQHFDTLSGVRPAGVGEQIEIDLVIRHGNQVAIAEVKLGRGDEGPKKGIDQLSTAGGREYLGTYTRKLLITAGYLGARIQALAQEKQVTTLQVDRYQDGLPLRASSAQRLVQQVKEAVGTA
jgi:hypothetical protein